jgi:hypothetical protein
VQDLYVWKNRCWDWIYIAEKIGEGADETRRRRSTSDGDTHSHILGKNSLGRRNPPNFTIGFSIGSESSLRKIKLAYNKMGED